LRKITVISAMVAIGLTGAIFFTAPAGARVSSASGTCKALTNLHITPSSDQSANGGKANAAKLSKKFSQAAKKAKGDIKTTLNTLASYFKSLSKGDFAAIQSQAQAFAAAATNFASYLATNCLPGGISIPTIPNT
jgi:fatty acid-binding protein DegV